MLGDGPIPQEGQEVVFHYNGYNESGAIIDSSYRKGRPAQTRLGIAGLIPGVRMCSGGAGLCRTESALRASSGSHTSMPCKGWGCDPR